MRLVYLLAFVPAAIGVALSAFAYFGHETGVDGTPGALLTLFGAVAAMAGILVASLSSLARRWRRSLHTLIGLGAILTAIAAWFLMRDFLAVTMLASLLGLLFAIANPSRRPA